MNKTFYFFIAILGMIIVAIGLLFYPTTPAVVSNTSHITLRDESVNFEKRTEVYEDMKAEIMGRKSRKIAKVRYKRGENVSKSVSNTGLVGYVNSDLSLSSGNILPQMTLNNQQQTYRRYISDNSGAQMVSNPAGYQQLQMRNSHDGAVQIGNMMGANIAFEDCNHENVTWSNDFATGSCNDCNGKVTITGDTNNDGYIDQDDMHWVPLGDVVVPMLMLALTYLFMLFVKNKYSLKF
jgi:hypothetical protein